MTKILPLLVALLTISTTSVAYEEVIFKLSESRSHGSIKFNPQVEE